MERNYYDQEFVWLKTLSSTSVAVELINATNKRRGKLPGEVAGQFGVFVFCKKWQLGLKAKSKMKCVVGTIEEVEQRSFLVPIISKIMNMLFLGVL